MINELKSWQYNFSSSPFNSGDQVYYTNLILLKSKQEISGKMATQNKLSSSPFNLGYHASLWNQKSSEPEQLMKILPVNSEYHVYFLICFHLHYSFIVEEKNSKKSILTLFSFSAMTAMFFNHWKRLKIQFVQDTIKNNDTNFFAGILISLITLSLNFVAWFTRRISKL